MKIDYGIEQSGCLFEQLDVGAVFLTQDRLTVWFKLSTFPIDTNAVNMQTGTGVRFSADEFVSPAYNATLVLYPKKLPSDT